MDRRKQINRGRVPEIVEGAEGDEEVDALNEGALENGPLPAEKRYNNQQRHQSMAHQKPLECHEEILYQWDCRKMADVWCWEVELN